MFPALDACIRFSPNSMKHFPGQNHYWVSEPVFGGFMEEGRQNQELRLQAAPASISSQGGALKSSYEMTPADQIFENLLQRAADLLSRPQAHSSR
jgi:hypothetical protein